MLCLILSCENIMNVNRKKWIVSYCFQWRTPLHTIWKNAFKPNISKNCSKLPVLLPRTLHFQGCFGPCAKVATRTRCTMDATCSSLPGWHGWIKMHHSMSCEYASKLGALKNPVDRLKDSSNCDTYNKFQEKNINHLKGFWRGHRTLRHNQYSRHRGANFVVKSWYIHLSFLSCQMYMQIHICNIKESCNITHILRTKNCANHEICNIWYYWRVGRISMDFFHQQYPSTSDHHQLLTFHVKSNASHDDWVNIYYVDGW